MTILKSEVATEARARPLRQGRKPRVYYYASVSTDKLNQKYGTSLRPGAATNKVMGICSALRQAGLQPIVVSAVIPTRLRDPWKLVDANRVPGVVYLKLFSLGSGVLKRIVSGISFLLFSALYTKRGDQIIFYNYFPEYILASVYLLLCGRPAVLDIEDSPRSDERGVWRFLHPTLLRFLLQTCANKYLTASRQIGLQLGLKHYLPIYGVSTHFVDASSGPERFSGDRIRLLYGGAIMRQTGLTLFICAVRRLAAEDQPVPLEFIITGNFPPDAFHALAREIGRSRSTSLTVLGDLTATEYRRVAMSADIGLCLKLPSESMGQTTFPSKVVEYAALGMLLCSTSVSDVPYIFDDDTAILLRGEDPAELAGAISNAAADRAGSRSRAILGRERVLHLLSRQEVGIKLFDFLYRPPDRWGTNE